MAAHAKSHLTRERAQYLRRVKGARHAHAAMRAEGRTPGDEGRAAIALSRATRQRDREEGTGWRIGQTYLDGT